MTISHHPSDMTLAELSAGSLDEGSALVVSIHVGLCATCRMAVRRFEAVGGALLDQLEPTPLQAGAMESLLARLGETESAAETAADLDDKKALPAPLGGYHLGRWRWLAPGVHWRPITLAAPGETRVFMLKSKPGTRLPHHRHQDREWTCVLQGAFTHAGGTIGPGDFDEADETVEHHPSVDDGETCICVVAMRGRIELQGFMGRFLQPLIRL
jgi:putative transcriptional regulator